MGAPDQTDDELYDDWDAAFRVGTKIIDAAERCAEMHKIVGGARATWHFTMDDVRFKVTIELADPLQEDEG